MYLNRVRSEIVVDLDKKEDALGLYAVMTGRQDIVSPEIFTKGQQIYAWLFSNVEQLSMNYEKETPVVVIPKYKR